MSDPLIRYHGLVMVNEERIYYSDANGVSVGTANVIFGKYKYATHNIESVGLVQRGAPRWPGLAIVLVGLGCLVYAAFSDPTWYLVGAAGIISGAFNLWRKKPNFALQVITPRGPVLVLASRQKRYVETVMAALVRAMDASSSARAAQRR